MVSGGRETKHNVWLESLKMQTSLGRDIPSVFTGELLPTKNMVGSRKTRVHKAAAGPERPRDIEDGSALRSPLQAAEGWRRGLPQRLRLRRVLEENVG